MLVNGVKCDVCDTFHGMEVALLEFLPPNWLALEWEGHHVGNLHFCSLECLRLWIPKHPVASEFVGQDEPETTKITLSDRVY